MCDVSFKAPQARIWPDDLWKKVFPGGHRNLKNQTNKKDPQKRQTLWDSRIGGPQGKMFFNLENHLAKFFLRGP